MRRQDETHIENSAGRYESAKCRNTRKEKTREAKSTVRLKELCRSDMTIAGLRADDITYRAEWRKKVINMYRRPPDDGTSLGLRRGRRRRR